MESATIRTVSGVGYDKDSDTDAEKAQTNHLDWGGMGSEMQLRKDLQRCQRAQNQSKTKDKAKCGQGRTHAHHTDERTVEMQENPRQEVSNSPRDRSVPAVYQEHTRTTSDSIPESPLLPTKERIKWPKMSETKEWSMLDEDLDMVLEAVEAGSAERKVYSLTAITYNLAREQFGTVPRRENKSRTRKAGQQKRKKGDSPGVWSIRGSSANLSQKQRRRKAT
ncbi:unnamed protein product [Lampetra planeri]